MFGFTGALRTMAGLSESASHGTTGIFTIPSPCRGVCEANSKGYCKGCLRSRDERLYWLQFSDTQKQHVLYLCLQRRKRLQQLAWQQRQADMGELWLPEQMDFEF